MFTDSNGSCDASKSHRPYMLREKTPNEYVHSHQLLDFTENAPDGGVGCVELRVVHGALAAFSTRFRTNLSRHRQPRLLLTEKEKSNHFLRY